MITEQVVTTPRRRAPLFALLAANVVSICGTMMTFLAIPWFVLETTGSAIQTGLVAGVEVAGVVASSVLGGPIVDQLGRKQSSVLSDLLAAGAVAAIPALHLTIGLAFWQLLALTAVVGLSRAPGETARSAMMPSLISLAGTSLERAAGAYDGVSRAAKASGAALAGVLIALIGAPSLLLIDGVTFAVSAMLVGLVVPAQQGGSSGRRRYLAELGTGFAYLRADRLIGAIVLMIMFTNALDAATASVLFPVYARNILHSSVALGLMAGVFGGAAMAGTMLYSVVGARLPRWPAYTAAFLIVGAPRYGLLAVEPGLPVILIVLALAGIACGAINPILSVVQYERLPADLRARVLGVVQGGALAAAPLGALLGGISVEALGLTATLLLTGTLYLAMTLCPVVFRVWRQMDRPSGGMAGED
jgi:MFS family permease